MNDIVDAGFRPIIGFFVGFSLGNAIQFAQETSVLIAVIFTSVIALIALGVVFFDRMYWRANNAFFAKIGWDTKTKPARKHAKYRKHWFVRFGWIPCVLLGAVSAFVLPEEIIAWL